jgi:hypothetical protein
MPAPMRPPPSRSVRRIPWHSCRTGSEDAFWLMVRCGTRLALVLRRALHFTIITFLLPVFLVLLWNEAKTGISRVARCGRLRCFMGVPLTKGARGGLLIDRPVGNSPTGFRSLRQRKAIAAVHFFGRREPRMLGPR